MIATQDFWGGEVGVALRRSGRRGVLALAAGSEGGAAALRLSATAQFLVRPRATAGTSPYAGIGVAWAGAAQAHGAAYLAVRAGIEASPARRAGWYVEAGLEGGVRLAAGMRWRRFKTR
jgi:hypothetical protein